MDELKLAPEHIDPPGSNTDFMVPSVFTGPASPENIPAALLDAEEVPSEQTYTPKVRMLSFVKTFVIWRNWSDCPRCIKAIEDDVTRLPQMEGDITCPHVQTSEYKTVKDKCLRGEGLPERETFSTLKDGTQIVMFSWLEEDKEYLKKQKEAAAQRTEKNVWPPNPELVFAQPVIPETPK